VNEIVTKRQGVIPIGLGQSQGNYNNVRNQEEVELMLVRAGDSFDKRTKLGLPPPTGRRYGYRWVDHPGTHYRTIVPEPEEAEVVKEMATRLLAGESLRGVVAWLNATNEPTVSGKPWTNVVVRQIMLAPVNTGLLCEGSGVDRRVLGEGEWEPIIDRDTWHAVGSLLAGQRTVRRSDGHLMTIGTSGPARRTAGRYLLTGGIGWCGTCEGPLQATWVKVLQRSNYRCSPANTCSRHATLRADWLEDEVVSRTMDVLTDREFRKLVAELDGSGAVKERERIRIAEMAAQHRKLQAGIDYGAELIDRDTMLGVNKGVADVLAGLAKQRAALPPATSKVNPDEILAKWDGWGLDQRRSALFGLGARVTVLPAPPGTNTFDPGRVGLTLLGFEVPAD
jgi:hypothetical protein